jgi:hypothetical protein
MGRTPFYTQTDINVAQTLRAGERIQVRLEATAMNLLNQAAVVSRVTQLNRAGAITSSMLPLDTFFAGWNVGDYVGSQTARIPFNPIYGLAGADPVDGGILAHAGRSDRSSAFLAQNPAFGAYQGPRTFRFGLRFVF